MVILGIILLVLGYLIGIGLLVTLGWILLVVGLILALVGAAQPIGGRRHWY